MNKVENQRLDHYYEALDLAAVGEWTAAHTKLLECVVAQSGHPPFVQAYLENLARIFAQPGDGKSPSSTTTPPPIELPATTQEVLLRGPKMLASPPWNVPLLLALAEACRANNHEAAAILYLQQAAKAAPNDAAVQLEVAQALENAHQIDDALSAWQRVEDLAPENENATKQVVKLVVLRSSQRLSLTGSKAASGVAEPERRMPRANERTLRDVMKRAEEAKRTPIQQLEQELETEPSLPDLYLVLATLYLEKGREYDAEKRLAKAKEKIDDERLHEMWENVSMMRLDQKVQAAEKQLALDSSEGSILALGDAQKARDHFQTEVFQNRCQREPENTALRLELGRRWKQAGKLADAYECFQVALNNPAHRGAAAFEMAECLEQSEQIPEALRFYRMAGDSPPPPLQEPDCRVRALYRASILANDLQLPQLAARYHQALLKLAPGHRAGQ